MRIKSIHLQNYKGFKSAERIEVNCQNLLIYGNNGSGKSSLYHALRQSLQSSTYTPEQIEEHFASQALNRNIFNEANEAAYVRLVVGDDAGETTYTFAPAPNGNTAGDVNLQLANQASDFMNYRLLFSFYNFRDAEEANLYPIFRDEFFPFWTDETGNITYSAWLQQLLAELRQLELDKVRRNSRRYQEFNKKLEEFNKAVETQILNLIETTNLYLSVYFLDNEPIEVSLSATGFYLDPASRERFVLHPPVIRAVLTNYHDVKNIERPHLLLNEARLTALALSLRFAAFENFLKEAPLKILVLDDLLISLDMSLRMQVINTILGQFRDYQLIMMTHDRGFFNVVQQNLALKDGWLALEFYENRINGQYATPLIWPNKDALTKAEAYLAQRDFEACALYLRKKAEELIRIYFDPTLAELSRFFILETLANALKGVKKEDQAQRLAQFTQLIEIQSISISDITLLKDELFRGDATTLSTSKISQINTFRRNVWRFILNHYTVREQQKQKLEDLITVADKVCEVRGRVLNLGAHHTDEPIFEQELRQALQTLQQFEQEVMGNAQP